MAAVALDTMVVSALLHPSRSHPAAEDYRRRIAGRPIVISFVVVTELRYGALKAGWGELRTRALERDLSRLVIVQPDDDLMRRCAELRNGCERTGRPLGQKVHEADRWVAAIALYLDIELVSDDAVFRDVAQLAVVGPVGSE